ncbi:MAG: MBL fold metallo-hydrolase [Clostridia bacterium]|nr:MBL fold metallo-hydrolase [Clostridia bacterium]
MPELRVPNVIPVNDHVWLLDDNHQATCYVVAGTKQAAVIDTSLGMCNIRAVAEALTSLPLICINTHGHGDHMGGNWAFEKAYMNLADKELADESINYPEMQEAMKKYSLRFSEFENVADGQVIDLGGVELEIIHFPGHTAGEIVLLDRKDRILFSGDGILEHLWLQLEESLPVKTQIESMEKLLPLRDQFDVILHGHCQEPRGAELFEQLLAALKDLDAGNTAGDIDYEWLGYVSRAYVYNGYCRIVHK